MDAPAWKQSRTARMLGPTILAVVVVVVVCVLSSWGLGGGGPGGDGGGRGAEAASGAGGGGAMGILAVLVSVLSGGPIALAYVLGAWGLGRPLAWWLARGSEHRLWVQSALGIATMLWLSHAMGMLGLLSGAGIGPRVWAWGVVVVGLVMLGDQVVRGPLRPERWPVVPRSAGLWGLVLALLIVAACNPPGWLWGSEFGAYDVLSYHLQLPKEWAAGERLMSVQHNVYSFLPSYVEAGYLHLGAMMPGSGVPMERMLGGEGGWIIACQMLHAMLGVVAGLLTARACVVVARRVGFDAQDVGWLGSVGGAVMLATPWSVVVSSLAYNEAAVLAMIGGGVLCALDGSMPAWARGVATGLLAGAATSAKPTAAFLGVPVVGIVLLTHAPVRGWAKTVGAGTLAGLAMIAPWLIRNWHASGNPLFPFAPGLLGAGHWSSEQLARYASNHHSELDFVGRVGRLFSGEFGFAHPQFAMVPLLAAAAMMGAIVHAKTRRIATVLGLGLGVQIAGWLWLTHLQPRFLVPMLVPIAMMCSLGLAATVEMIGRKNQRVGRLASLALAIVPLGVSVWSVVLFLSEGRGRPNELLVGGPGVLTGMAAAPLLAEASPAEREDFFRTANPIGYVNLKLRPPFELAHTPNAAELVRPLGVYLLGDGAPLYVVGALGETWNAGVPRAIGGVRYHTTWDASPLGEAMASYAQSPAQWTTEMRKSGIGYVLIHVDELRRLVTTDRYFDPRVTFERLERWIGAGAAGAGKVLGGVDSGVRVERRWPRRPGESVSAPLERSSGYILLRLDPPGLEGNDP